MGVTVTEDVTVRMPFYLANVYDNVGVLEDISRNLFCLIKPVTAPEGTFGKTDKGGTLLDGAAADRIYYCKFQSGSAGVLTSIDVWITKISGTANVKCAIYDSSKNQIANGETEERVIGIVANFETFVFPTPPSFDALTDYYLAVWASADIILYASSGSANQCNRDDETYNGWPGSLATDWSGSWELSIYATYSETTAGPLEAVSLTESLTMHPYSFVNVYDSIGVTDIDCVFLLTLFNLSVYDSPQLTESLEVDPVLIKAVVSDSSTLTELITSVASLADIDVYDSTTLTESVGRRLISFISEHEDVTITEVVSALAKVAGISVYEAIGVLEKIYLDFWIQRIQEDDIWTQRTKETDTWTQRTKEIDTWTQRTNKEI